MQVERQAIGFAVRKIEVIVDNPAIPVHAARRAGDVRDPFEDERDRACREHRILVVRRAEPDGIHRETLQIVERRPVATIVEQHPVEEQAQCAPARDVERRNRYQARQQGDAVLRGEWSAAAHRQDMRAHAWIREQLGDARVTHDVVEDLARPGRYLRAVGILAVTLGQVGCFEAVYRCERVGLPVAREAPRADRRADRMHRRTHARQQRRHDDPVELAQDQPLRATRGAGDRADALRREALLAYLLVSAGAGADDQGLHVRAYPNGCCLMIVWPRSGPVEMMSTGTPASSSMRAR